MLCCLKVVDKNEAWPVFAVEADRDEVCAVDCLVVHQCVLCMSLSLCMLYSVSACL